jgi:single-strand DNA-binding protein
MANLNKVMLIGRLTRDPEVRTFSNGGKVAKLGFAVNNRKKNQQTGEWEDEPVFLDVDAFNRETRKLADLAEQYLGRGHQVYIEGHLVLDQWTDTNGQKRSKLKVVAHEFQFLEPKADGGQGAGSRGSAPAAARAPARSYAPPADEYDDSESMAPGGGTDEEIPF